MPLVKLSVTMADVMKHSKLCFGVSFPAPQHACKCVSQVTLPVLVSKIPKNNRHTYVLPNIDWSCVENRAINL